MAVYARLDLNDPLVLCIVLLLQRCSVFHFCSETVVRSCGGQSSLGGLEGVGEGCFKEHGADLVVFLGILALQFAPLLVKLLHEVGLCCPPQLVGSLFPVFHEFGLKQATGLHLGHKVVHLIFVGDRDPMVFAINLVPVQLERKGGDVCFWSVPPQCEEVGFYGKFLHGGNGIPHTELIDYCFYCLVFVPDVIFL